MAIVTVSYNSSEKHPYNFSIFYKGEPCQLHSDAQDIAGILSMVRAYLFRKNLLPLPKEQLEFRSIPDHSIEDLITRQLCSSQAGTDSGTFVLPK